MINDKEIIVNDKFVRVKLDTNLYFEDNVDHFENGFLRLLGLDQKVGLDFIRMVLLEYKNGRIDPIDLLSNSWNQIVNQNKQKENYGIQYSDLDYCGIERLKPESIYHVNGYMNFIVAVNNSFGHGWLLDSTGKILMDDQAELYEQEYYEGSKEGLGYGDYQKQKWRAEKMKRLAERVIKVCQEVLISKKSYSGLDAGSGYGDFVQQINKLGHYALGVDTSKYATEFAKNNYNVDAFCGNLAKLKAYEIRKFDFITMWDYLEHPFEPWNELKIANELLTKKGLLFIKTPNINAAERFVFGPKYHSFKREHLHYFSKNSLEKVLQHTGFSVVRIDQISHLFGGFSMIDFNKYFSNNELGSDLFVIAQKSN